MKTSSASGVTDPDDLPDAKGAYLLLIDLTCPLLLPQRFDGRALPPGRYGYAGSAYGPGGIRARCRRHLDRRVKRHWHVDWLTSAADGLQVMSFPGGRECALIETLIAGLPARCPIPGFGSSDCHRCPAHLVGFDDHPDIDVAIAIAMTARM